MRLDKNTESLTLNEWKLLDQIHFSKRQIECLWNYYWMGKTQKEIAYEFGIKRPVVSIYLKRARSRIARHFGMTT